MTTQRKQWVSWEELNALFPDLSAWSSIDFQQVGGLTPGSIPVGDADGMLTEDNTNLFWDDTNNWLGLGTSGPVCRAHIRIAACPDYAGLYPSVGLLIEDVTNAALQLQSATNGAGSIVFADDNFNPPPGRILYSHVDHEMNFAVGGGVLVFFRSAQAEFRQNEIYLNSNAAAYFTADSHDADAYFALEEDNVLKWTMGFDFNDGLKFQISEGIPGTNVVLAIPTGAAYLQLVRAGDKGLMYMDTSPDTRWMMRVAGGTDIVEILNRAANGTVEIHANTAVAGVGGDVLVAEFQDDIINLSVNLAILNQEELRFYEGVNYVGFEAPALIGNTIWVLPDADGGAGEAIVTDGARNLSFAAVSDEKVAVDNAAVADYLGAASNDGILRVSAPITYADGGNFVTLALDGTVLVDGDFGSAGIMMTDGAGTYSILPGGEDLVNHNLWIGTNTLDTITLGAGQYNYGIGEGCGTDLTTGDRNTFFGYQCGFENVTGTDNVYIGYRAGYGITTESHNYNVFIGSEAGYHIETGANNMGIGRRALYDLDTGTNNLAMGYYAGYNIEGGTSNTFMGSNAGFTCIVGSGNVCLGRSSGYKNTASYNVFIGHEAGYACTSASASLCIGYRAGYKFTTGNNNIFIGANSGSNSGAAGVSDNTVIGASAVPNITGYRNVYIGTIAGNAATGVIYNCIIGYEAHQLNQTGDYNCIVGVRAGRGAAGQSNNNNTFLGYYAGYDVRTGSNNVLLGFKAGEDLTTGAGNVAIGYMTASGQLTVGNNQLWIANSNTATPLIYGEFDNGFITINGYLNITTMKSGATQVAAGAGAGELWFTNGHATLLNNIVMMGV